MTFTQKLLFSSSLKDMLDGILSPWWVQLGWEGKRYGGRGTSSQKLGWMKIQWDTWNVHSQHSCMSSSSDCSVTHLHLQNVDRRDESDRTDAYETESVGKKVLKCRHVFQLGCQISTWYRGCSWWHNWSLDASPSHHTPSEGNRKEFKQQI